MVPEGWSEGKVSDLLVGLESGVSVNGEDRKINPNEMAVLKVSAVSYGFFDPSAAKVVDGEELERAKTNPKQGQIIISRSNTEELVGASAYVDVDYPNRFLPDKLWQTVPKPNSDMKWLSYVLASDHSRYTLSNLATGTSGSMKNITKGELLSLKVLIPPATEQKKIAQILTTWDKAITTTEQLLASSQQQKKALMQQLLTGKKRLRDQNGERFQKEWLTDSLNNLVGKIYGGGTPSRNNPNFWGGTIPWVTVKDLISSRIGGAQESITDQGLAESSSNMVPSGTVIISTRMAVGKTVVASVDVAINQDLKAISPSENVCSDYLFCWFTYHTSMIEKMGTGSTVKGVQIDAIKSLKMSVPSTLEEQQKIAAVLSAADQEITTLQQQLEHLKQEKKALMQQLLTGKRRVKLDEGEADE